jgi:hypothetical protein
VGKKTKKEAQIQQEIMLEVSKSPSNLIVRRNVGLFKTMDGLRTIKIGQNGEADVQGIIGNQKCPHCGTPVHPLPFAIEVKDETNTQDPDQVNWQKNVWERRGGLYILARSKEDAMIGLKLR